eukprot:scaffold375_cov378-Prasinococcus_capsulatus_cf.AAC.14
MEHIFKQLNVIASIYNRRLVTRTTDPVLPCNCVSAASILRGRLEGSTALITSRLLGLGSFRWSSRVCVDIGSLESFTSRFGGKGTSESAASLLLPGP